MGTKNYWEYLHQYNTKRKFSLNLFQYIWINLSLSMDLITFTLREKRPNTEFLPVRISCIQSEYGKIGTRKNSVFDTFRAVLRKKSLKDTFYFYVERWPFYPPLHLTIKWNKVESRKRKVSQNPDKSKTLHDFNFDNKIIYIL